MQLNNLFCYASLLIFAVSFVEGYVEEKDLAEVPTKHSISKREAILLIDNFPVEPIYKSKPKVIYRRISKQRPSPKLKYGSPRTKYRSVKPSRRPFKKYKSVPPKYGPPSRKKRPNKPRYGPPKYIPKPIYGPPKKYYHQAHTLTEPVSFGEPPYDYNQDFSSPKQSFAEPPVDSHRSPSRPTYELYKQPQEFKNPTSYNGEPSDFAQEYNNNWNVFQNDFNLDTSYDYTNKQPIYMEQETQFDPSSPEDDMTSYIEQYKYREFPIDEELNVNERKRQPYYIDSIITAKERKAQMSKTDPEELVVGGQYAEPPGRIVYKRYSNDSPYSDDYDFSPGASYVDPNVATSATMSPYINYKNSNLAFSPQNLNDAFSIVDKK